MRAPGARLGGACLLLAAFALACAGRAPEEAPAASSSAPSSAASSASSSASSGSPPSRGQLEVPQRPLPLEGAWISPPCGRRNYERRLELRAAGRAALEERVSPCPEGTTCVWSGVEHLEGAWRREGDAILLRFGEARPLAVLPPERLTVASEAGDLFLASTRGCRYRRPPAPEGEAVEAAEPAPASGGAAAADEAREPGAPAAEGAAENAEAGADDAAEAPQEAEAAAAP